MKKTLKRSLSVLLAVAIVFSSAYVGLVEIDFGWFNFDKIFAVKAEAASTSDLTFTLNADGSSYSVTDCNTYASGSLTIPSTYGGKPVTIIGDSAFEDCSGLTYITIPNSVTGIAHYAFWGCESLASITIPDSVKSIGSSSFRNCTNLTSITISDNVEYIGAAAFFNSGYYNDSNNWENDVLYIGDYLIEANSSLFGRYVIKNGTKLISSYAFYCCSSLTSVIIPNSVKTISEYAFASCRGLTAVSIPNSVTSIGQWAFGECESLISITIPNNITRIAYCAFTDCTSLKSVTIPSSVTRIDEYAFDCCTSLNAVYITDVAKWCNIDFYDTESNPLSYAENLYLNGKLVTDLVIPNGVTSVSEYAFRNCTSLKSVTIPASVTSIDYSAFFLCEKLSYVFYSGSQSEWNGITIENCNAELTNAKIHYSGKGHTYSTEWTVDVNPTCVEEGSKSRHCTICNDKIDVIAIPSLGHDYSTEWTIDVEPTCTEEGSKSRHCITCNYKTDITIISSLGGHSYSTEWTTDIEPTCEEEGSKSRHCIVCDCKTDVIVIPSFGGHYFENDVCVKCNQSLANVLRVVIKTAVLQSSHNYQDFANETRTFTAPGATYINVTFSSKTEVENGCDYIYIYDGAGILVGTYTGTALRNKTITVNGDTVKIKLTSDRVINRYGYYATCNAYKNLECNNHMHKKFVGKTEADCINNGYTGDILCAVCETVVEQGEVIPAPGHSCDNWVVDNEATCTMDGSKHGVCSTCGEDVIEVTPAIGHQNTEWITEQEPNCTEAGYKDEWCLDCGEIVNTEEIPATGHQTTEWITEQEPNCTEAGYKDEWCLDCGELINTEEIPELGHSYGDWIIDTEPTCTEDGSKHQICSVCGDVNTEIILSEGHSFSTEWTIDVAPTCTEEGSKSHHCTACEEITDVTVVEALGHTYSTEWTIDVKATCTEEGSKSHHCIDCDNAKADVTVIAPLGHNFRAVSVANEHPHIILSECSRCPETKEEESYSEKCGVCNFTYTENADGTCKITAYTGSSDTLIIPATINGKTVATTNTGAFKNNTTLTTVKIENGVQGIGSLAFIGCSSLSEVVIPESVTNIGSKAFYNCSSDLTIYCYSGSYAMQYAIDNSLNYEIINIAETDNCTIDYDNKIIFTNDTFTTGLDEIADLPSNAEVSVQGSFVSGSVEIFGTGSKVTITDGDSSFEYTLIINGDLNGDGTCDVIDASLAYLYSVDMEEASEIEIIAANGCVSDELDANSYQNVVNMCLA